MESLLRWDTQLLLLFNGCHNTFLDTFFWNVSTRWLWIPLYAVLVACIIRRYGRRSLWVLLAVVAAVGLADYVSSGLIKHWVCRPRPTHAAELEGLLHILNGYRGGRYGFVSSHAANCMALALSVSLLWRE
ncbi:MAG: phosphatase PAP2 family protein, partial [Paludibacteraceae bacterium]|nr:phosphatase PAP2 family protein [Paludibacteraceae bacterium]